MGWLPIAVQYGYRSQATPDASVGTIAVFFLRFKIHSMESLNPTADQRMRMGGQLFLLSLGVFFIAGMMLYFLLATWRREQFAVHQLPRGFLSSTGLLIFTSGSLISALSAVRRERRRALLISLSIALIAGLGFILFQSLAMQQLISDGIFRNGTQGLWGGVVTLAVVHALHVVGGLIGLVLIFVSALRGKYDHERYWPIEFVGSYWHFLDAVWLSMLASFWLTSNGFS